MLGGTSIRVVVVTIIVVVIIVAAAVHADWRCFEQRLQFRVLQGSREKRGDTISKQ